MTLTRLLKSWQVHGGDEGGGAEGGMDGGAEGGEQKKKSLCVQLPSVPFRQSFVLPLTSLRVKYESHPPAMLKESW